MRFIKWLAVVVAVLAALGLWVSYAEQTAAEAASDLCGAIQTGMPAQEARRLIEQVGADAARRIDTPQGVLMVFTGAFPFSRYTCQVDMAERVGATRLGHVD
jgi:hypothetical protein